ncbi:MAG: hypothetical protein HKN85_03715 [Gammaproteobacteria bacterium]|nr:hypothetical protein [Gammaproteobacteria bacterium]
MYQSITSFQRGRYLWVALGLSALSILAYWWHQPIGSPNGGTWLGYTLGTIGALLIVWLMLLGIRKRSYNSNLGTVQGWTSAHVYLGTALLLVATLHCGVQFGMNIHTLAYVLMVAVIASGFFGLYAYLHYPQVMTMNRAGDTLDDLLQQIRKIDERCIRDADSYELRSLVDSAVQGCDIGGNWWQQLRAKDSSTLTIPASIDRENADRVLSNANQARVINTLANRLAQLSGGHEAGVVQNLLASFAAKQVLLKRIRRDVQVRALMKIWLFVHVPLSLALLAALTVHIIVVFYYW